ncbi:hypothetical protein EJB05_05288, partial [Eragrostis curvula]
MAHAGSAPLKKAYGGRDVEAPSEQESKKGRRQPRHHGAHRALTTTAPRSRSKREALGDPKP